MFGVVSHLLMANDDVVQSTISVKEGMIFLDDSIQTVFVVNVDIQWARGVAGIVALW